MISKTYTKYIQSLQYKKPRDAGNHFIAEGTKVVPELLQSGKFECEILLGRQAWLNENEGLIRENYKGPLTIIEDHELEKISALTTPNQVLGVFKKAATQAPAQTGKLLLALESVQDPGNLGTIIRIADWFGITDIVCSNNSVDQYNPKVVQSTMGSLGRVNVFYTELENWLQHCKLPVYATALQGTNIRDLGRLKEGVIIIGNESKGISEGVMMMAGKKITIPKMGNAESLNAAIATGIILSHVV